MRNALAGNVVAGNTVIINELEKAAVRSTKFKQSGPSECEALQRGTYHVSAPHTCFNEHARLLTGLKCQPRLPSRGIESVNVSTANCRPESGRMGGSVMEMILKSGTNAPCITSVRVQPHQPMDAETNFQTTRDVRRRSRRHFAGDSIESLAASTTRKNTKEC